jgi:hypothetical protein
MAPYRCGQARHAGNNNTIPRKQDSTRQLPELESRSRTVSAAACTPLWFSVLPRRANKRRCNVHVSAPGTEIKRRERKRVHVFNSVEGRSTTRAAAAALSHSMPSQHRTGSRTMQSHCQASTRIIQRGYQPRCSSAPWLHTAPSDKHPALKVCRYSIASKHVKSYKWFRHK